MLIFAWGDCETAAKASLDKIMVDGHGRLEQKSTTLTSTVPPRHGLLRPLRHLRRQRRPHAAPLSHSPSLTAANRFPDGNWSPLLPLHRVAAPNHSSILVSFTHTIIEYKKYDLSTIAAADHTQKIGWDSSRPSASRNITPPLGHTHPNGTKRFNHIYTWKYRYPTSAY